MVCGENFKGSFRWCKWLDVFVLSVKIKLLLSEPAIDAFVNFEQKLIFSKIPHDPDNQLPFKFGFLEPLLGKFTKQSEREFTETFKIIRPVIINHHHKFGKVRKLG